MNTSRAGKPWFTAIWIFCLLVSPGATRAQKGYDIVDNKVVVQEDRHWENWQIPTHLARIDRAGGVRSRPFRAVFNVLSDKELGRLVTIDKKKPRIMNVDSTLKLDALGNPLTDTAGDLAYDYVVRTGVSRAGSNPHLAARIVDGDPTTFWEPNPADPLEDWWVEVDLGQAVPLERIRLDFVEEGLGDPFSKFILLLSSRQSIFLEDRLTYLEVFIPFEAPNTEQRLFVFDSDRISSQLSREVPGLSAKTLGLGNLESPDPDPNWTGKLVEVIRIVVTHTRGSRAAQISPEQWEALPRGERGDIVYFLSDAGFEEPVEDQATYESLDLDRQGRKEYYRRERPRLAEVEAWGWGDNISPGIIPGGGSVQLTGKAGKDPGLFFDGDWATGVNQSTITPLEPGGNLAIADIGGTVWLDQVRLVTRRAPRGYVMRGSSGIRDAQGELQWQVISPPERETNLDHGFFRMLTDPQVPARRVRFIELGVLALNRENLQFYGTYFESFIHELMLFSEGPPAEVVVESNLIELPGLFTLGAVRWEAETPPGSEVEIRTRSGDQRVQRVRYFDKAGNEKTAAEYKKMLKFLKGPTDTSFVAGPGWSAWSQKYLSPGEPAKSPSLRRFLQLQARLINHDRQAVPVLNRIAVELHTPLAQSLLAEVWPATAQAGRPDTFEVFVQPNFVEEPANFRSQGIDEVLIRADPGLDMRLLDVALGTEEALFQDQPALLFDRPGTEGLESALGEVLQVLGQGDSLWVRFPAAVHSAQVLTPKYYRQIDPGEEVPTGLDGELLTVHSHAQLPEEERGAVRYFRRVQDGDEVRLEEVDQTAYEGLQVEEQGPIRYFRKVMGLGNQVLFDEQGDTLNAGQYTRLNRADQGWVVGRGQLLRLRFTSAVFLNGTQLQVAVRHSGSEAPWQEADGGDVTALRSAETLVIAISEARRVIDDIAIAPNPFTPNGDAINDVARIEFSLFKVYAARPLEIRIFSLDGRPMRSIEGTGLGGRQKFAWDGRDDSGELVPPGLYLCQIEVEADTDDLGGLRRSHLIAVAY